ncbi:putative methyltransferase-domain-containing protein [Xylogone sp. PMI_703]|nr:putative methyltransferase-domain-containing protein [Xylogone sp. PMI_703]
MPSYITKIDGLKSLLFSLSLVLTAIVLDLPKLRQKPSYSKLYQVINSLTIQPRSWDGSAEIYVESSQDTEAISRYLTAIIGSDLSWLSNGSDSEDEIAEQRDTLWELASKRLAERCGRTAMPEMSRIWTIPATLTCPELRFEINEPSLTGDNLGFKTWGTAFSLTKQLGSLGEQYLSHLFYGDTCPNVLELGSGTGLVGIGAAAIWKCHVVVTDLPDIQSNLQVNVRKNEALVVEQGGSLQCEALDWMNPPEKLTGSKSNSFKIVLASDPLYDEEHPELVANMIARYQFRDQNSRAIVAVPMRDKATIKMAQKLVSHMNENGHELLQEGQGNLYDDWEENGEPATAPFWYGIFRWEV